MKKLVGIFIDDLRDLEIPDSLNGVDVEWHVVRSIRELVNHPIFNDDVVDYVCFDYYLDDRGSNTGQDAINVIHRHYSRNGWKLPVASFHSSDSTCNNKMKEFWIELGGEVLSETVQKKVLVEKKKATGVARYFRRNKK